MNTLAEERDITERASVTSQIDNYNEAQKLIEQGYALLNQAQDILDLTFPHKYKSDYSVLPPDRFYGNVNELPKIIEGATRRETWKRLYSLLELDKILSIKRAEEIEKKLREGELPELTLQNVFELFETLRQNTPDFAKESVKEVYDWLRPREDSFTMTKYKTNQKNARFELGNRVVVAWVIDQGYGDNHFRCQYTSEKKIIALDRVFHMLDGKLFATEGYRGPLVDAINTSGQDGRGETEYFKFRACKNRSLHIEFKRLDLVKEFNAVAGGANLKPVNS